MQHISSISSSWKACSQCSHANSFSPWIDLCVLSGHFCHRWVPLSLYQLLFVDRLFSFKTCRHRRHSSHRKNYRNDCEDCHTRCLLSLPQGQGLDYSQEDQFNMQSSCTGNHHIQTSFNGTLPPRHSLTPRKLQTGKSRDKNYVFIACCLWQK